MSALRRYVAPALVLTFANSCGIDSDRPEDEAPSHYSPVVDCVVIPEPIRATVDRSRDPKEATAGCRSFESPGCSTCCRPITRLDGINDCLLLSESGERLLGTNCPHSCLSCAEFADCSLDMEDKLQRFKDQQCGCNESRGGGLGCWPDEACDCYCMDLELAASRCPHLVCDP